MKRTSLFLRVCAAFAVLCALECWIVPPIYGFENTNWKVAWCSSASSNLQWGLFHLWSTTAIPIVFFALKRNERLAYISTIGSFCLFWLFAFLANPSAFASGDLAIIGGILSVMLWKLSRVSTADNSSNPRPQVAHS